MADSFDELECLFCGAATEVHEVVGVDGRDFDLAHPRAFEAGCFYDAAGEISVRSFEGRAAARPVRGAVHTLGSELFYAGLEFRRVTGNQRVARAQDDPSGVV